MTVEQLGDALNNTGFRFAHFAWSHAPAGDYGVYAEDEAEDFLADGHHTEKAIQCAVDLFTRTEGNVPKDAIENALEALNAPWYLNTVQYEDDTGYIHYEWIVTVM